MNISSDKKVEWNEDFSEEAVKKRREEEGLSERIQKMTLVDNEEKEEELLISPNDIFEMFMEQNKDAGESHLIFILSKIKTDHKLKDGDIIRIIFESIFNNIEIIQNLKKKKEDY